MGSVSFRTASSGSTGRRAAARAASTDPEAKFRKYGKFFGQKGHIVDISSWMNFAPQVRIRQAEDRGKEQIGELAVLNERLAGQQSWQIRKRVEYLKQKRRAWEGMVNNVVQEDVVMTLSTIEHALREVEDALTEEKKETSSISDLKQELLSLQEQVEEAHDRLHLTQARVEQNIERITELKAEAATFERINRQAASAVMEAAASNVVQAAAVQRSAGVASTSQQEASAPAEGATPVYAPAQRVTKKSRGLNSSLNLERGLRNFWYPVSFSSSLKKDMLMPLELFGEKWVLFRDTEGKAACIYDQCAHRACPLSLGTVTDGEVACPYHGWQFNNQGECTKMPSTVHCKGIAVAHMPTVELDGWVWVWAGDAKPTQVPRNTLPPSHFTLHAEIEVEVPVEHGLLMENLLDLAHAPFTHTGTFAKGWPIPDVVRFQTAKVLGGFWDPYPIDMTFEPPCLVVSMIGLKQPGQIEKGSRAMECERHLHQLHVCLPSRKGHTRLLYRMSLDFMEWVKYVPGIQAFWKYIAGQVLGEDLVLVTGQQDRMLRGGDTWSHPVSYDKLAVRYRRWRNDVGDRVVPSEEQYVGASMSAGDLFSPEGEVFVDLACPVEPSRKA